MNCLLSSREKSKIHPKLVQSNTMHHIQHTARIIILTYCLDRGKILNHIHSIAINFLEGGGAGYFIMPVFLDCFA
jgi:hypothetical protein